MSDSDDEISEKTTSGTMTPSGGEGDGSDSGSIWSREV